MKKILILTSSFQGKTDKLSNYSVQFNKLNRKLNENELIQLLDENVVGIIAGLEPYTSKIIDVAPNLKVISRCGAGTDNISNELIDSDKLKIYTTPDAPTKSVVELTLGLILSLLRRININDASIKRGEWNRIYGNLLFGKTVGIIGLGRIGLGVADLLTQFGAEVIYFDINTIDKVDYKMLPLDGLIRSSDIISIHLPYNPSTINILSAERLVNAKKNSLIINTSRGGLLDEDALYNLLKENKLGGAALDVFSTEPYKGPLTEFTNVILTPHIGSYTIEGRTRQEEEAINNLLEGLGD